MATTVHEPPKIELERLPGDGSGKWHNIPPVGGELRSLKASSPPPASTGIWVGLAAITMTFAAFTSALIVRQGASNDWHHFALPSILYLNSLIIIVSSVTLETAKKQIGVFMTASKTPEGAPSRWLYITLILGLTFVAGQTYAWLQLRAQGFGLSSNVSYSFFYVLTVAHALHVLGGIGGLVRVMGKLSKGTLRRSTLNATALYWHFMGALWLYLLLLLWMKL
jgi:cytochrome c oxidase subunit III